jgi:hypothetical protein
MDVLSILGTLVSKSGHLVGCKCQAGRDEAQPACSTHRRLETWADHTAAYTPEEPV